MSYNLDIQKKQWPAHNVIRLRLEKPEGFHFEPSQAIELTLDEEKFDDHWAPFTFTNLDSEDQLELTIRVYFDHDRLTKRLAELDQGDKVRITEPWDSFEDRGPGVFIAGGTGITPFIAMLRDKHKNDKIGDSKLIFSNKTRKDAFMEDEFKDMLGENFIEVITEEKEDEAYYGHIDGDFLQKHIGDFNQPIYVCGPPKFEEAMKESLIGIGANKENIILPS